MIINNKKYEISTNLKYGLMRKFFNKELTEKEMSELIKQMLTPTPSEDELNEFGYNDILDLLGIFGKKIKEKQADMRKKFSQ